MYFMTEDSVVHVTCNTILFPRTVFFFFFFFFFFVLFFFFFGGGGGGGWRDIERNQWPGSSDIDGQDHMLNLVMVIAIF